MDLKEVIEIYELTACMFENIQTRNQCLLLRKQASNNFVYESGLIKVSFDTRRIDQETEYNPRRGLQNYNRSEAFISEALEQKVVCFTKLRGVLVGLKNVYGKQPEWQDSNARVLLSTLDKGLRTGINDEDFAVNQPGVGSFDYLEELLHVRYRLGFEQLARLGEPELQKIILSKDEELIRKNAKQNLEITKNDVATKGYDSLVEKLLEGCKATADSPDVERTITITIRDKFHKES